MLFKKNNKGQLSLYDALLYFTILLVVTTVLFFYALEIDQSQEFLRTEDINRQCEEARKSIVRSTVVETSYIDKNGVEIVRNNHSVENLIIEKLYLLDEGVERKNISYTEDIYNLISEAIRHHHDWGIIAVYEREGENLQVNISNIDGDDIIQTLEDMDVSMYTSSWTKEMILEKDGRVRMDFVISPRW